MHCFGFHLQIHQIGHSYEYCHGASIYDKPDPGDEYHGGDSETLTEEQARQLGLIPYNRLQYDDEYDDTYDTNVEGGDSRHKRWVLVYFFL